MIVYLTNQRSNAQNTSVHATLGSTTYYLQTPDDDNAFFDTNGFVRSTDITDNGDFSHTLANYIRFEGVSGASFSIDFAATQGNTSSDSSRLGIGGVQITEVQAQAVPEPNTSALGTLALLGLVGFTRRRRRNC